MTSTYQDINTSCDYYAIVFESDSSRNQNYKKLKAKIPQLKKFSALNTIANFSKYSKLAIDENLCSKEFVLSGEVNRFKGKLGCNMSHILCHLEFLKSDSEWLIVLEDDAGVNNFQEDKIKNILNIATDNKSDFIQLYTNPDFKKDQQKQKPIGCMYEMIEQWHTIAYAISRTGINKIQKEFPMDCNIDLFYSNKIKLLNSLCWINNIFLNCGEVPKRFPTIKNGKTVWGRHKSGTFDSLIWKNEN
jgi:GR25 family glycosyltransferase involved in LPS biosynthesis